MHQEAGDYTKENDCTFSLNLLGDPGTPANHNLILSDIRALRSNELVAQGSTWQYDQSGVLIANFAGQSYTAPGWKSGVAPLGACVCNHLTNLPLCHQPPLLPVPVMWLWKWDGLLPTSAPLLSPDLYFALTRVS